MHSLNHPEFARASRPGPRSVTVARHGRAQPQAPPRARVLAARALGAAARRLDAESARRAIA